MFKAIGHLFGFVWDFTVALLGGNAAPLVAHYIDPAPAATSITELAKELKNLTPNGESIIGLRDPSLTVNSTAALVQTTFDTTTYGDRAIIKLANATGASINLTGMCIKGKPVMQLAGQNGYVWEYSDYDAIEKEGEQFVEVSNDFIFDPVQAKQIGDFVWKELKPHKLYSLMLVGCQYQYEIGDVYHLTLVHIMNGGTMENIDTDVEVMGTSMSRDVGGVGATNLNLRVPSEAWALTLAKNSKLVGAGNAQRLNNRSNVVTVASSTWTGQADYFCDGTDDNVEIQAAIDYLGSEGGEITLTSGQFNISSVILNKSNVTITGYGYATVIVPSSNTTAISNQNITNSRIQNITIDYKSNVCFVGIYCQDNTAGSTNYIENVRIVNASAHTSQSIAIYSVGTYPNTQISKCYIGSLIASSGNVTCIGIYGTKMNTNNKIATITGFGTGNGYGMFQCVKCQQNEVISGSTAKYYQSYSDSVGTAGLECADTAAGGYNS